MAEKAVANILSKTLEQLPKYSGQPDQDADEWLKDLTSTFRMADITESQALKIIPTFLEGSVKQWFMENITTLEFWNTFKTEFTHTYSSPTIKQLASHRLRNRQQRFDKPVIEFYTDIMTLCKIVDPNMTDVSKLDHLYHGLEPSLMKEVPHPAPNTPSNFLEHAKQEETLDRLVTAFNNQTDRIHPPPSASTNLTYQPMVPTELMHFENSSIAYPENDSYYSAHVSSPRPSYSPSHHQQSPRYQSDPQYSPSNRSHHQPRPVRCYRCHRLGHLAPDCRNQKKS